MPTQPTKSEAKKNQYVGDIKETAGHAVGNQSLENEGRTQHGNGLIQETTNNLSNLASDTVNTATGVVNGTVNTASGAVNGLLGGLLGNNNNNRR